MYAYFLKYCFRKLINWKRKGNFMISHSCSQTDNVNVFGSPCEDPVQMVVFIAELNCSKVLYLGW